MRFFPALLLAFFLLAFPLSARAAPDAAGAEALKKDVQDLLSWHTNMTKIGGEGLSVDGDIEVTPKEKFYEVKISHVTLQSGEGFWMDVGTVVANATPGAKEGEWLVSLALPSPIILRDAASKPVADILIGGQKLSLEWLPRTGLFPKIDASYRDLSLKPREGTPFSLTIGGFATTLNLTQNADGTWSGPHTFDISSIVLSALEIGNEGTLKIDRIRSDTTYDKLPMVDVRELREKIQAIAAPDKQMTQAQVRAMTAEMFRQAGHFPDSFTSSFELTGFTGDAKHAAQTNLPIHLALARLAVQADAQSLQREKGGAGVKMALSGLQMSGVPVPLDGLLPSDANIEARLENMPVQEFGKVFSMMVDTLAIPEENQEERLKASSGVQAWLESLPQLLAGAGTTFTVKNTHVHARDMDAQLDAHLSANAASPVMAAGTANLTLVNMDETINAYAARRDVPMAVIYAQMMTPFQLLGQLEKGADGRSLRKYTLDFQPDGKILLNGADLTAAKALLQRGVVSPAAPAAPQQAPQQEAAPKTGTAPQQ